MIYSNHASHAKPQSALALAVSDVILGIGAWRVWGMLGWHEIVQRYRRSSLGALWVSLNMAIQILIMGYLLGFLFDTAMNKYLPFISVSLVLWSLISGSVNECSGAFLGNAQTILQIKRPLMMYVVLSAWRNTIVAAHTILVFIIVAAINGLYPSFDWLLFIPGIIVVMINVLWMGLITATLSARFRDVPLMISNFFAVMTWLTPIFYFPSQLAGKRAVIIKLNPFTYMMDVVRAPLLHDTIRWESWAIVAIFSVLGWIVALLIYARCRHRIAYWL